MTTPSWSQDLYIQTYHFAAVAHQGQCIPGTQLPYIMHLSFVTMEILAALSQHPHYDGNLAMQCALLHDAIEDTEVSYAQVRDQFGVGVANGVLALSKDSALPKAERMQDSLNRMMQQPAEVRMVKLADRITNLQKPPAFWSQEKIKHYHAEAALILETLGAASDFLAARLQAKIDNYAQYIASFDEEVGKN